VVNLINKIRNFKYSHLVRGLAFILLAILNLKIGISQDNKIFFVIAFAILVIALICFYDKKLFSREK